MQALLNSKSMKRGQNAWNTSDNLFFFLFGKIFRVCRIHAHVHVHTTRIVRRQLVTRTFENRGAASVALSKPPPRYPSYRPEHYVSHYVAHVFCRRGFVLGRRTNAKRRTPRDEKKRCKVYRKTKEQGNNKRTNIIDCIDDTRYRVSKDLYLLVTNGCVFVGRRGISRRLRVAFTWTRFTAQIPSHAVRTYVAHTVTPLSLCVVPLLPSDVELSSSPLSARL